MNNTINKPVTFEVNENLEGVDTEQGLDLSTAETNPSETLVTEEQYLDEEEQLRIEFQKAIERSAEDRANSPFQVAALTHSRMCGPFLQNVDNISGGAAKRILKYLVAYPFYVKELNPQNKEVEAMAQIADRLVNTKFTMALCVAIEKETRVAAALKEQEDLIKPLPDDIVKAGLEENKELMNDLAELEDSEKEKE